jgi:hypothetical protein
VVGNVVGQASPKSDSCAKNRLARLNSNHGFSP